MVVIILFVFQTEVFLAENEDKGKFENIISEYQRGIYRTLISSIEGLIKLTDDKEENYDFLGKCYLLIGAIYEKEKNTLLAEENYSKAKNKYKVVSIAGVDLDALPIYNRIVKCIIQKEASKKKKKSLWPWIVGGAVVAAAIVFFHLKYSKKKSHTLEVKKDEGIEGYPEAGRYSYKEGTFVNYDYRLSQGGGEPIVTINGNLAPSKGGIIMVEDYKITVSIIKIHIESTPSESEVYVDNQNKGILTPCYFSVSPGSHEIKLVKNGYGEAKNTLVFEKNKDYNWEVVLAGYIYKLEVGGTWGGPGSGEGRFLSPAGVAIDRQGNVYIADGGNQRIQIFDPGGRYKDKWGERGILEGQFLYIDDIAIDDKNHLIYVLDSFIHRVQKFSLDGAYQGQWGVPGDGDGEFKDPKGISVDQMDFVYVADSGHNRIQKFDCKGTFKGILGIGLDTPGDIAFDKANNAYVCDSNNNRIQKLDPNGSHSGSWGEDGNGKDDMTNPYSIAVDDNDFVYVCDRGKGRIQKFVSDGTFGCKFGEDKLTDPCGIAVTKDGDIIYVVDNGAKIVQKFKMSDDTDGEDGDWELVTITAFNSNSSIKTHLKFPDTNRDEKAERIEKLRNKRDNN